MSSRPLPDRSHAGHALPGQIWALGFASLLMDASSELVHSLLPLFMTTALGASMVTIGLVEGVAEATASVTKVFSGMLSDYLGKRKFLLVCGYGLGAAAKPVFPMAATVNWVFLARFIDRIGKGIRGAPRDALVADLTAPATRGAAYGLRQALDSIGAFVGPLLAVVFMALLSNNIRAVLWLATIPAVMTVVLLVVAVREPQRPERATAERIRIRYADLHRLPPRYWLVVALGAILTLARFSEAFLVLRAHDVGMSIASAPAVMIVMNVVYAASAFPAGRAADRWSARPLLVVGIGTLIVADTVLAQATTPLWAFAGTALWGLHMGLTQGLLSKLVADAAIPTLRGTAFGIFNLVAGGALLVASVVAGWLWNDVGPSATFTVAAVFAGIAGIGLAIYRPK